MIKNVKKIDKFYVIIKKVFQFMDGIVGKILFIICYLKQYNSTFIMPNFM